MAGENAVFGLTLDASGVDAPAQSAAARLLELKAQIEGDTSSLKDLQSMMRNLKGATSIDTTAYTELRDKIAAAKEQLASSQSAFVRLGGSASAVAAAERELGAAADQAAAKAKVLEQVLAKIGAVNVKPPSLDGVNAALANMMGKTAPAVASGTTAIKSVGVASAQSGDQIKTLLDASKGALGPMGGMFERANLIKQAVGQGGMTGAIVFATVATLALAAAVGVAIFKLAEFAVTSNKAAMSALTKATDKLKKDLAALFSGVHVDKFVAAVKSVLSIFDESQASAKALKAIVEILLNPLFDAAEVVAPFVRNIFRGMVIGALLAAIGILTLRNAILKMIPPEVIAWVKDLASRIDWMWTAVTVGVVVAGVFAAALAVLTVALGVIAVAIVLATAPLLVLIAIIALVVAAILAVPVAIILLIAYFDEVKAYLGGLVSAGAEAASGLISGLVNGLVSGGTAVVQAVLGIASGAKNALMGALGIASPSKVFLALGKHTAAGFAEGVDAGADNVNAKVDNLVATPEASPAGKVGAARGGSAGAALTIGPIYIQGVQGADEMTSAEFARKLAAAIEEAMGMGGVPLPEGAT